MLKEVPWIGTGKKSPQDGQLHTGLPSVLLPGQSSRHWSQVLLKDKTHGIPSGWSPLSAEVEISLAFTETYEQDDKESSPAGVEKHHPC